MFLIGERINGVFRDVRRAIEGRDKAAIQDLARLQLKAGADALDISVGPAWGKPVDNMRWLVEVVQEVTQAPICVDTAQYEVAAEALRVCRNPAIINSTKATKGELERYMPLAVASGAQLVVMTIDETGVPPDAEGRAAVGAAVVARAQEQGLDMTDLYIDPVVLPVKAAPQQAKAVLGAIARLRQMLDPAPNFVVGLSNVSHRCRRRTLLNRVFLSMCIGAGLNAAVMDVLDADVLHEAVTAEVFLGRHLYSEDYVGTYLRER
jgi:5-methyltetrahydrofolate corrinoid/iron sulfur protein methyltransferase